jgi:hypothetical protein
MSALPSLANANSQVWDVYQKLMDVLTKGDVRLIKKYKISKDIYNDAKQYIDYPSDANRALAQKIIELGDATQAALHIQELMAKTTDKKQLAILEKWERYAVAYFNRHRVGGFVDLNTGDAVSRYKATSFAMDNGREVYWSKPWEMVARAFQVYLEYKMYHMGMRNVYLSRSVIKTEKATERGFPGFNDIDAIVECFDNLFKVLRDEKILENATENTALMDSIFGESHKIPFSHLTALGE